MNAQQPGASTAATLRPRNRRLISIDDEFETLDSGSPSATDFRDPTGSAFLVSGTASSIPSTHPSRSASTARTSEATQWSNRPLRGLRFGGPQASSSTLAAGLWESSWTSIQGLASAFLGSDVISSSKGKAPASSSPKKRKPAFPSGAQYSANSVLEEWGPSANTGRQVAQGSKEDRLAQVQAKKREILLTANGQGLADSTGNYKRRVSEDRECMSAPPLDEQDRDALVYLHHVQPSDTLAGVAIKYNCPIAVFRKANRLWPNDRIQLRDIVYLPVDACGVKGRKVPEPQATPDLLLGGDSSDDSILMRPSANPYPDFESSSKPKSTQLSSMATSPSISTSNPDPQDPPWKHDSWVIIDPSPVAIEIARISRRTLGFFPPSRRKSATYSDLETPSRSLDISRTHDASPSPGRHTSPRRHLSPRQSNKIRSTSGSIFGSALSGPGGVGTLGRDVLSPGPAQDKLNQLFAPHLPNVAPRTSFESVHSTSSTGIESVGGAIEGWMRKMATKAAAAVQTPPLRGKTGAGDLIELVEGWELDGGSGDADTITEGREGRSRTSQREDEERMLGERFPVRGRVFEDKGRKKGN